MANSGRKLRCAIYTRKSTEEGLEKEFNSLDAQREACVAYIMSQQHEGWILRPTLYDDGGFSGGSMDRPALQQLLLDVKAGEVDVVVVYKIDRLTRSLADFAKIVDVLDDAQASFVSVTQAFSTTTSMGRLTLNVLLSFAQFEREVIAERIRDKVAASKAKGMWMGGGVPLGYEAENRKLIIVPEEAATVRYIMEQYLVTASVPVLVEQLGDEGIVTKRRTSRAGRVYGGKPFKRGSLAWLLKNRVYIGEVVHKGNVYSGEHDAIVPRELFDAVQAKLRDCTSNGSSGGPHRRVSLLAGMIRDDRDRPMSPVHTRNHGRRYSYYASSTRDDAGATALRLPAGELEAVVRSTLSQWLLDAVNIPRLASGRSARKYQELAVACEALAETLAHGQIADARKSLKLIQAHVRVERSKAAVSFDTSPLLERANISGDGQVICLPLSKSLSSFGHEPRLRLEPTEMIGNARDERLVELVARAFSARDRLLEMDEQELKSTPITRLRHLQRTARLAYLDPAVIRQVLQGRQPSHLAARNLWRMADLPLSWSRQRAALNVETA